MATGYATSTDGLQWTWHGAVLTGLAHPTGRGPQLRQLPGSPVVDIRYLDVLPLPTGGHRLYYEARLPGESHELRTELV
jgi:hypothetical protein